MDRKEQEIRDALKRVASEHGPDIILDGTVLEVDAENYFTDVLLDTGDTLFECRLRATATGSQSIDILPEVGSAIVVAKIIDDEYIVIACDKITSYRVTTGTTVFEMDADGVQISKGTETLNKILTDLVNGLLSVAAPKDVPGITLLLTRINNLLK